MGTYDPTATIIIVVLIVAIGGYALVRRKRGRV
jgi:LPXTG-motif cell wall-anchored protein